MTDRPKRIQQRRIKGWRMPVNAVKVSRPSEWGNPFRISPATHLSGDKAGQKEWWVESGSSVWMFETKAEAQDFAVDAFRKWFAHPANEHLRARAKLALKGRDLACWCKEGDSCHADVLLELANIDTAPRNGDNGKAGG